MRKRKFPLIENYFDTIDTEIKAYFLGLLWADGCNYKKNNSISIALQEEDSYILEKIKNDIFIINKPLRLKKAQTFKSKNQFVLSIYGKYISDLLENYGMIPKKSLSLKFPRKGVLNEELIHHFIRGYFDGDGCISSTKKEKQITCTFVGTFEFLTSVKNILINVGFSDVKLISVNDKDKNTFVLSFTGRKNALRLYQYMYKNANFYLIRKYEKFKNVKTDEQALKSYKEKVCKPIIAFNTDWSIYKEYDSIIDAYKDLNVKGKNGSISKVFSGKQNKAFGLFWKYKEGFQRKPSSVIRTPKNRELIAFNKDGSLYKEFNNFKEACENVGAKLSNINHNTTIISCISGRYEFAYGYKWEYKYKSLS